MKQEDISIKLRDVYSFVSMYYDKNGFPPSVREICRRLSIKSTSTTYSYLQRLKNKGLIETQPYKKRTIQLSLKKDSIRKIPILEKINETIPYVSVDNVIGYCPLNNDFNINPDSFAIKMPDNSMTKAGLLKDDLLIINRQKCAKNGDIVLAIFNGKATVKRFIVEGGNVILRSETNNSVKVLYLNVKLLGNVCGIIRKL